MNLWRKRILWIMLAIILIGLLTAAAIYFPRKSRDFNHRPLVLIHAPYNNETFSQGDSILLHASAYSQHGVTSIEFWAGETLIETRETEEDITSTTMMLLSSWVPTNDGPYQLIVRAVSETGIEGQASITIFVEDTDEMPPGDEHIVGEDETLEDIAAQYGASADEIAGANPGLGSDGPQPGDSLFIPSGDEPASEPEPLPEGGEPPEAEDEAPGDILADAAAERDGTPTGLRLELVSLRTNTVYEGLHCYIGLADSTPMWYPDLDGNQSTDESFALISGAGGDRASWNTSEYLTGLEAPTVFWPDDQGIPLEITCVAIVAGGTEALELGRSDLVIPPDQWDGIIRYVDVEGPEGSYSYGYRIVENDTESRYATKEPDPSMTTPTNLRLDDRRNSLRWDYEPREDEEPIDGFRIYLNGTLQWTEPADALESMLPYEWFHPPCYETYTFSVTAFTYPPDDRESVPNPETDLLEIFTPRDECNPEIWITFTTLRTFDMPGDGEDDDVHGDVGPVYGSFTVNYRHGVSFDCRVDNFRGLDRPMGLASNHEYDLMEISADPGWHFSGMPSTVVEIPQGGTFEFGFHISDQDFGRCRDSGDPGCDDTICEAMSGMYSGAFGEFARIHEGTLRSDNGRCEVDYIFMPNPGSAVESGVGGGEPLPWIDVEELVIDPSSGQVSIHIRNTGTATWPLRDLDVELQTRDGDSLGVFTWEDYILEVGQRNILEDPEMVLEAPYDACIVIDPFDEVRELYEVTGALYHSPICPQLPDLIVTNVEYSDEGSGHMYYTVQNIGTGAVENRSIAIEGTLPDGSSVYIGREWPVASLPPGGTRVFDVGYVNEALREMMQGGYTVTVNPDQTIPESNYDNNSYEVRGSTSLQLFWCYRNIPHTAGLTSAARMYFRAWVQSGDVEAQVVDESWSHSLSGQEVIWDYGHNEYGFPGSWYSCLEADAPFEILGDQWLRVTMQATYRRGDRGDFENLGTAEYIYGPEVNWHAGDMSDEGETWSACIDTGGRVPVSHAFNLGTLSDYWWYSAFLICEVE